MYTSPFFFISFQGSWVNVRQRPISYYLDFGGLFDKRLKNVRDEKTTSYGVFDKGMSKIFHLHILITCFTFQVQTLKTSAIWLYSKMAQVYYRQLQLCQLFHWLWPDLRRRYGSGSPENKRFVYLYSNLKLISVFRCKLLSQHLQSN